MKRILPLFAILFVMAGNIFAQDQDNQNDNDNDENPQYVEDVFYRTNDKGDQFLKIAIMPNFPLNFDDQLYIGGSAILGYYRFLNPWLALGGELMAGYNPTKGSNIFTFVPVTMGVLFQPSVWRFEFPITLSTGFTFETCANKKQFPGWVLKAEAGAFYRLNESWSFGLGSDFIIIPQWAKVSNTKYDSFDYGLFLTGFLSARYHF